MTDTPLTTAEFEAALRAKGAFYHIHHPYHVAMYEGRATREQIQGWVANRFYYQVNIPLKDAAILANCPDREIRREWIQRLLDHDGAPGEDGGIEAWLRLGQAVGLDPDQLRSQELVLPGVRFAVDAYVNFARRVCWQEAASSSLTELFAPQIHQSRLDSWPQHYPWIDPTGYEYFRTRLGQARRDVEHGPGDHLAALHHSRRSGAHVGDSPVQTGHPLEHARCHEHGLRIEPPALPQRDRATGVAQRDHLMSFDRSKTPRWRPGYRFQYEPAQKGHVLLYPEGMIKLNDSASLIGGLIDGERDVAAIIGELAKQFPDVPELGDDIEQFMEVARAQHWIELA